MKEFSRKFENIMAAITFAEAGEFETAREMLKEQRDETEFTVPAGYSI